MKFRLAPAVVLAWVLVLPDPTLPIPADAGNQGGLVDCQMTYSLGGWSVFYKSASGTGMIRCDNGQTASVTIRVKGGGITFGKTEGIRGTGSFTGVKDIGELFGSYAQAEAHAGAGKSADAQVLTKGKESHSLVGKGRGINLGVAFGKFTIRRVK